MSASGHHCRIPQTHHSRLFDLTGFGSSATALGTSGFLAAGATPQHIIHNSGSHNPLQSIAQEPMAVADDDFYYPRDLEASFCRDFSCCGLILNDLHDLLQHYEECHVRFEEDEAQADLTDSCFFDDEWS
ncbi:Transcriptional regulator of ribosomal biogenesis proteins, partial [Coemansia sp. RSA 2703]